VRGDAMSTMLAEADVAVIGSGVCGATAAYELTRRGARVVVHDKEAEPGPEASARSFASLRVQGRHPAEIPLMQEAMALWREAARTLGEEFEFVQSGNVYLAQEEAEVHELEGHLATAHRHGLPEVRLLSGEEIRARIPALAGPIAKALWSPYDGQCDPQKGVGAYLGAALRQGARFLPSTVATGFAAAGGRLRGVVTDRGEIRADAAVVCAGAWTRRLLRTCAPALPIKILNYSVGATSPLPRLIELTVRAFHFGCRQARNGEVWFSAGLNTRMDHELCLDDLAELRLWGPRLWRNRARVRLRLGSGNPWRELRNLARPVSPGDFPVAHEVAPDRPLLEQAFGHLSRMVPAVAAGGIARVWGCMIDLSPDGLPIVGLLDAPRGVTVIAGLSGHGYALAPVLGRIAADLALDGYTAYPIAPFRPSRFREGSVEMPYRLI